MLSLETNSGVTTGQQLADELLARVAAPRDVLATDAQEAPEIPGAFSWDKDSPYHRLYSSIDEPLPDVYPSLRERMRVRESDSALGYLASQTMVSLNTGCWAVLDAWRCPKGYTYTWDPGEFDIKRPSGHKGPMRHYQIAYILRQRLLDPGFEWPTETLDHVCRNTACCNPTHLEEVDKIENNRRQRVAHPIEAALAAGQLLVAPTGYAKIDAAASVSLWEDTGVIVNTRFGPHRIVKVEEDPLVIHGEPVEDELLANLQPPKASRSDRKSRRKMPFIHAGQDQLVDVRPQKPLTTLQLYKLHKDG